MRDSCEESGCVPRGLSSRQQSVVRMTWAASALFSARRRITTSRSRNRRAAQESTRKSIPRSSSGTSRRKTKSARRPSAAPKSIGRFSRAKMPIGCEMPGTAACGSAIPRPIPNVVRSSRSRTFRRISSASTRIFIAAKRESFSSTSSLFPAYMAGIMRSAVTKSANRIGDVMLVVPHRLRHDEHQTQCDIVPAQLNPCHLRDSDP